MSIFDAISILLPALIAVITKSYWSKPKKIVTAFGVCFGVAFVQVLVEDGCSITCLADLAKPLGRTFALAMTSYAVFWKNTGLAEKIEEKVNP